MSLGKGIAIGFVAGFAATAGAFLLLRDNSVPESEATRLAELDAHIQQLDQAVSNLSGRVTSDRPAATAATATPSGAPAPAAPATKVDPKDAETIAEADAMVEQGMQSGYWSRQQETELQLTIADLDVKEQVRIMARVSAAINAGQIKPELPSATR